MRKRCPPACGTLTHPGSTLQNSAQPRFSGCPPLSSFPAGTSHQVRSASFRACACVSPDPRRVLGAVGSLGAGAVVMWIRCPEENIINHQNESSHRHAEEIDDGHGHFHPDLSWHVGVFGPQLPGVARPPLHVPAQLLRGRGDLSASRFHAARLLRGATLVTDVPPDSSLLVRVWTAETAAPPFPIHDSFLVPCRRRMQLEPQEALTASWSSESVFAGGQIPGPSESTVLMEITELKRTSLASAGRDRCQRVVA